MPNWKLRNISNGAFYIDFREFDNSIVRSEIVLPFAEIEINEEELTSPKIQRLLYGKRPQAIIVMT